MIEHLGASIACSDLLHEKITPVNTFRVIFRQYFGGTHELIEDRSYFSLWKTPYDFVDVTDTVNSWVKAAKTSEDPKP